jgi:hypothetical protein
VAQTAQWQASTAERRRQLAELEQRLREAQDRLTQERSRLVALQQTRTPAPSEQILEFRVAFAAEGLARAVRPSGVREVLAGMTGGRPQAVWEFAPGQSAWAAGRALPEGVANASPTGNWRLVGFVDAANARVRREVFARVQAVRDQLIAQGIARDRIALELRPVSETLSADEQTPRLIFMLPLLEQRPATDSRKDPP